MKSVSSTLPLVFVACLWCHAAGTALAQDPRSGASGQAVEAGSAPGEKKVSWWSRLTGRSSARQEAAAPAPRAEAPQAAPPQAEAETERKPRFNLKFPKLPKPDFSRIPKLKMPDLKMPKLKMPKLKMPKLKMPKLKMPKLKMPNLRMPNLRMPKVSMPKIKWPFQRDDGRADRQQVQDYPRGVSNPKLGGAYAVIREESVKFYELGPSQPFGPDEVLAEGTMVTLRSNDRSWAYVTLRDGRSGYIGLDQLRLASAAEAPRDFSRPTTRRPVDPLVAEAGLGNLSGPSEVAPSALPTEAVDLSGAESNPLLQVPPGDLAGELEPVDSPEVLFDPLLEPLDPIVPEDTGAHEPFLTDPIPSIEEELRAIQEAKERAAAEKAAGGVDESEGDENDA